MSRSARLLLPLLVFGLVSAWLGVAGAGRPIDVDNRAMKATGTPEAEADALRAAEYGVDRSVILAVEGRSATVVPKREDGQLGRWLRDLGQRPEVARISPSLERAETLALIVVVDVRPDAQGLHGPVALRIAELARETLPPAFRLHATGQILGEVAVAQALVAENARLTPMIGVILLVALWVLTRSWVLALAPMLPALGGIAWVSGMQAYCGVAIDPVGALQAPVLLTVGVASAVHLVEAFHERIDGGLDARAAAAASARALLPPAVLTALTTVAGFLSLTTSDIPAVARFGWWAGLGVALTQALAFVVVPAWLALLGGRIAPRRGRGWAGVSLWLGVFARRRGRWVVALAAAAVLAGIAASTTLRVDTDPIGVLPAHSRFRRDTAEVARLLGGIETFELHLPAPGPAFGSVQALRLLSWLTDRDEVVVPTGPPRSADSGSYLVGAVLRPGGSAEREPLFAAAEERARELGWAGARAIGPSVQVSRDSERLVHGQLKALLLTLAAVWLVMVAGFRSLALGTLGLIPNVLPCAVLYGGMALLGQPLSVGSAMIGAVMLGLIVDDTIHFLHGYARRRGVGRARTRSSVETLRGAGRAVSITSLVLAMGFCTAVIGDLETTRVFGLMASTSVVVAWLADVLVLPSTLLLRRRTPR